MIEPLGHDVPLYVVAFRGGDSFQPNYQPVVTGDQPQIKMSAFPQDGWGGLHAFWFLLHLPRTVYDIVPIVGKIFPKQSKMMGSANIMIHFVEFGDLKYNDAPTVLLYDDEVEDTMSSYSLFNISKIKIPFSELYNINIVDIWNDISEDLESKHDLKPLRKFSGIRKLEKLSSENISLVDEYRKIMCMVISGGELQIVKSATFSIGFTGMQSWVRNRIFKRSDEEDKAVELALGVMLGSNSLREQNRVSIVGANIDDIWASQQRIEDHFQGNHTGKPSYVKREIEIINDLLQVVLPEQVQACISDSQRIIVYSDLPLGMYNPTGGRSPLGLQKEVINRPTHPLGRNIINELMPQNPIFLDSQVRVLVADLIEKGDRVGDMSKLCWDGIKEKNYDHIKIETLYTTSIEDLNIKLEENPYDIMLLSAHGWYRKQNNMAGIFSGETPIIGLELPFGSVPPIVILSSCSISVVGRGAVTISDLLMRQGAMTVLGAIKPINVIKNSFLMDRLFLYLNEYFCGTENFEYWSELVAKVFSTNTIIDLLVSNKKLHEYAFSGPIENTVLYKFMNLESIGRLRKSHIIEDTEKILVDILNKSSDNVSGMVEWINKGEYLIESSYYMQKGYPDYVFFDRDRVLREHQTG